jgi:hypothetical protein
MPEDFRRTIAATITAVISRIVDKIVNSNRVEGLNGVFAGELSDEAHQEQARPHRWPGYVAD